jgi:uncharacterized phage-associated protein
MVNKTKYQAVILYFANKIRNGTLGKTKLMKLLYYLDFDFFELHGRSVTNDRYVRMPCPVPKNAETILNEMAKSGIVMIKRCKMPQGLNDKELIVPCKEKTLEPLSKEEIEMLEEISDKWEKFSGRDMKMASHGEAPWIATKPGCIIDYNLAYYRNKYNEMAKM